MAIEVASWVPYWYELDQTIEVGQVGEFEFFKSAPGHLTAKHSLVFYHGDWHERCRHLYESRRIRIVAMTHATLGPIKKIDTSGLSYRFEVAGGESVQVNAEEEPGVVESGYPGVINDWHVGVEFEAV